MCYKKIISQAKKINESSTKSTPDYFRIVLLVLKQTMIIKKITFHNIGFPPSGLNSVREIKFSLASNYLAKSKIEV